ncbi:YgiW/YdeI family stress tolerance OB fold protein [Xylophilus sp.]|uniref:YgiW/YdeI family stress tolerance OB fold protein n=1 Tax=Xylophilus sp. TaxID=2653893 RepID=UPI0013B648D1|nr:NirD/YgiW/YdeI family stress tolerance protein [Xylophilus sp.]KAF1050199.1 MAG: Protein YgiW [Xylophilus sp.]
MKFSLIACGLVVALLASQSHAQPPAPAAVPAPGVYTGPSAVPHLTVQELRASAHDDQIVRLQGRILSSQGGKHYLFGDATGQVPVEISPKRFPPDAAIGADQRVEIVGEVDKDFRKLEVEVQSLRRLP